MDQLTVFTTVLGYTDPLHEPPSNSKARFICFTDCDIQSKGWQLVKIEPQKDPKRLSKQIKALSHLYLHTEWSLWIDCCFDCLVPPESLVGYGEFVTFKHKDRSNVYDESRAVIKLKKAKAETVKRQMRIYTSAGFPVQSTLPNGLSNNGAVLRRHTDKICAINDSWGRELATHSLRDQLSLDFVLWQHQYTPQRWPGTYDKNPYFKFNAYRRPVNDF